MTPTAPATSRRSLASTLTLMISLTSAGMVALACGAFVVFAAISARKELANEVEATAGVVAANTAGAIMFNDDQAARRVLSALGSNPHMLRAAIFRTDGALVAEWNGPGDTIDSVLTVSRSIVFDNETIGTIRLTSSLDELYARIRRLVIAMLLVLPAATVAAFVISARVQRMVSRPVLELAAAARHVSMVRDYSIRVRPDGGGELFALTGAFNDMLAELQSRDAALEQARVDERRLEGQLRQAQKMDAIGTLAGGIAHDFNNILGAIIGYTDLAMMDIESGEYSTLSVNLSAVNAASARARDLVRQILAFSRRQEQSCQEVVLAPVVKEAIHLLRASLPASIDVRLALDGDAPPVLADPTQVHQIVMNLGTNAWHAMRSGGVLEIGLRRVVTDAAFVKEHIGLQPGHYVVLSVRDSGCGMSKATIERIFEPFFTTKGPGEGTGLGLAMVHGIMKNFGGTILVDSEPGRGTTFELYFPVVAAAAAAAKPVLKSAPSHGRGQRILFVDDEGPLADWGRQALERLGYHVTCRHNARAAIEIAGLEPFDVVVTDLTMPDLSGIELAAEIHKLRPGLPIILTTGNATALEPGAVEQHGIRELLLKPNTLKSLGDAVSRALAQPEAA